MRLVNLSAEPLGKLHSWIPHDLEAETIVFLPDACPGKSPLPTGTAVLTRQENWRKFAVSDCGCGMRLLRSELQPSELDISRWDRVADKLRSNKGRLGDLGGGNHFLDAIEPYDDGPLHFLIHTGSRAESGHVDAFVDNPSRFDQEFDRVVQWAADNRDHSGENSRTKVPNVVTDSTAEFFCHTAFRTSATRWARTDERQSGIGRTTGRRGWLKRPNSENSGGWHDRREDV